MYKIGMPIPSPNSIAEMDFAALRPADVNLFTERYPFTLEKSFASSAGALEEALHGARSLIDLAPAVIGYACTSAAFRHGLDAERELARGLTDIFSVGTRVITADSALIEALRAVGAHRVAIASPYSTELNRSLAHFFQSQSFHVTASRGLNARSSDEMAAATPQAITDIIADVSASSPQAIVAPCTNFPISHMIADLERLVQIPVIGVNQALSWSTARAAGSKLAAPSNGQLFSIIQ